MVLQCWGLELRPSRGGRHGPLLWRHAEAVDGTPDQARELTERGIKQARRIAHWLAERRPKRLRVLVSPTMRTARPPLPSVTISRSSRHWARQAASPTCSRRPAGPTPAVRCWWSATNRRLAAWRRCCWPVAKPTGRSRRARCGGSQTACAVANADGTACRDTRRPDVRPCVQGRYAMGFGSVEKASPFLAPPRLRLPIRSLRAGVGNGARMHSSVTPSLMTESFRRAAPWPPLTARP